MGRNTTATRIQDGSVRVEADRTGSFLGQFQAVLGVRIEE
jgi:hypothetical protein